MPAMGPEHSLPLPPAYCNEDAYVKDLLRFVTHSNTLQLLVGGVHILDFFTRSPDMYEWLLEKEWRDWFDLHSLENILDFLLREDLDVFLQSPDDGTCQWREQPLPPESLVNYMKSIRDLSLCRDYSVPKSTAAGEERHSTRLTRKTAVGMKPKKMIEVDRFARFVQRLTEDLTTCKQTQISHIVDFGSGQNYLGRVLASKPYSKHVIAVESKPHNVEGAKIMDIYARLAPKSGVRVDKKLYRATRKTETINNSSQTCNPATSSHPRSAPSEDISEAEALSGKTPFRIVRATLQHMPGSTGSIQYVQHRLQDGDLTTVIDEIADETQPEPDFQTTPDELSNSTNGINVLLEQPLQVEAVKAVKPNLMVISLHSCGNLLHHGLRSLVLNDSVRAVAMIGCCYNLVTERLTSPSYKLPSMRPQSRSFAERGTTDIYGDPHGYPMSSRLCEYQSPIGKGVHWNITSRMMAVQAPQNWGKEDSDDFFTRHFFRALLQKIFLDQGVVDLPSNPEDPVEDTFSGRSPAGAGGGSTQPIIIGSLRKSCYQSFVSYVRGTLEKLRKDPERARLFHSKMGDITDAEIQQYADSHATRKKHLSIVWSLMACSAALVEASMVVDRWLWLREQESVEHCWVEPVFEFDQSPRNLVVVGIKRSPDA